MLSEESQTTLLVLKDMFEKGNIEKGEKLYMEHMMGLVSEGQMKEVLEMEQRVKQFLSEMASRMVDYMEKRAQTEEERRMYEEARTDREQTISMVEE